MAQGDCCVKHVGNENRMKLLKLLFDDHHGELALCTVQVAMQLEWQWWEPYAISVRLGSATGAGTLIGWVSSQLT